MADITVTRQDVQLKDSDATTALQQAGEVIDQGELFYIHTDGKAYLTDADDLTKSALAGVALTPAATIDDYFLSLTAGSYDPGGVTAAGTTYVVSTTPGAIAPDTDLTTGKYISILGVGMGTGQIDVMIHNTSVTKP
jgi:hypothetical protein